MQLWRLQLLLQLVHQNCNHLQKQLVRQKLPPRQFPDQVRSQNLQGQIVYVLIA